MDKRIIFACPFPRDQIAGGIRTTYRHAELLRGVGMDASVFSPDGHPTWFQSDAKVDLGPSLSVSPADVVVINEIIDPVIANFLRLPATKQMFCQNQFYAFGKLLDLNDHSALGISEVYGSSQSIRQFYHSIYGYADMDIVPYAVDGALFRPHAKKLQIAFIPRKLPFEAGFIQTAFRKKYPQFRSVPWVAIEQRSEAETAAIMAESAVFLALGHRDSFGLPAIEAMSAGCAVAGFHGIGGLEFAKPDNGMWFHGDQLLDCVDGLFQVVRGIHSGDAGTAAMVAAGRHMAASYDLDRTRAALLHHFQKDCQ
ncbi:MAG: glycosyltransferase family 1 protein [Rhodospirillaceae bacterium]|nr:glycosyltransferase family 1 protein [Rhodospirillales bacterium]